MQFQWMRRLAAMDQGERKGQAALRNLQFVIREEFGEHTNRLHWHALVSGLKPSLVRPTTCLFMMGYWEGIGGGMARVRVYDAAQDGASYLTKGLEGKGDWTTSGANAYEVGKFNGDQTLMLIPSTALLAEWKREAAASRGLTRLLTSGAELPGEKIINHPSVSNGAGADNRRNEAGGELFPRGQVTTPNSRRDARRSVISRVERWTIAS